MTAALNARQAAQPYTLAAGVPTTIDLPINGAANWLALLANTGANPVTAGTVARSPLGGVFEDAVAIPAGDLPAAGVTMPVTGEATPVATVRLVLTSALGTALTVELGGT